MKNLVEVNQLGRLGIKLTWVNLSQISYIEKYETVIKIIMINGETIVTDDISSILLARD